MQTKQNRNVLRILTTVKSCTILRILINSLIKIFGARFSFNVKLI